MKQDSNCGPSLNIGLDWLGDGANILCMPLLNVIVMCGNASPVVVSICDCTDHMSEGEKKDAT